MVVSPPKREAVTRLLSVMAMSVSVSVVSGKKYILYLHEEALPMTLTRQDVGSVVSYLPIKAMAVSLMLGKIAILFISCVFSI